MNNSSLSDRCKEIVLGSILGDGSLRIHRAYRNARFSFRHSIKQKEYFFWKVSEMKEISRERCVWEQDKAFGEFGGAKLRYQSQALESLTDLYKLTHRKGELVIRRKWLNQLTPLSLCVWWLDDGSLVSDCRQGVLCTDDIPYDQLLIAVRYFRKVWGLYPRIGRVSTKVERSQQYRLWFRSSENLKKFFRIILPHVPTSSMIPKVLVLYKDPELQERWISEMCNLSQFDRDVITYYSTKRKEALAYYRE